MPLDRASAMDHVVLVLFENRSFDNLLGRLYEPGEVPSFEGVIGKNLSNPIPEWAEHGGGEQVVVPTEWRPAWIALIRTRARSTSTPTPSCSTCLDEANRFKDAADDGGAVQRPGARPTADHGRLRHRLHQLLHRRDGSSADL